MANKLIVLSLTILMLSCNTTLSNLKPSDIVYQIIKDGETYKPCYFKSLLDLARKKNITCVGWEEVSDRLVIHPDKLKEFLTQGVDQLLQIQNQEKPKP